MRAHAPYGARYMRPHLLSKVDVAFGQHELSSLGHPLIPANKLEHRW